MAKNDIDEFENFDGFELDNDDLDADFGDGDSGRKASITSRVKNFVSDSFMMRYNDHKVRRDLAKATLPKDFTPVLDGYDEISNEIGRLATDVTREFRNQESVIKKFFKQYVAIPEALGLDGIVNYINDPGRRGYDTPNQEQLDENQIQSILADTFQGMMERQGEENRLITETEMQERASDREISNKRFKISTDILSKMNESVGTISSYTTGMNFAYQKRSIELQARQLITQQRLLEAFIIYKDRSLADFEAIHKNTGLPDYLKIEPSEMARQALTNRAFDAVWDGGAKKIANRVMGKIRGKLVESVRFLGESAGSFVEMAEHDESEVPKGIWEWLGYTFGGSQVEKGLDFLQSGYTNKVAPKIRSLLERSTKLRMFGSKGSAITSMFPELMAQAIQTRTTGNGLLDFLLFDLAEVNQSDVAETTDVVYNAREVDLGKTAILDNRFKLSITDVIPAWLKKIYGETHFLARKKEATDLIWDFNKEDLVSSKEMAEEIDEKIERLVDSSRIKKAISEYTDKIYKNTLSVPARKWFEKWVLRQRNASKALNPLMMFTETMPPDIRMEMVFQTKAALGLTDKQVEILNNGNMFEIGELIWKAKGKTAERLDEIADASINVRRASQIDGGELLRLANTDAFTRKRLLESGLVEYVDGQYARNHKKLEDDYDQYGWGATKEGKRRGVNYRDGIDYRRTMKYRRDGDGDYELDDDAHDAYEEQLVNDGYDANKTVFKLEDYKSGKTKLNRERKKIIKKVEARGDPLTLGRRHRDYGETFVIDPTNGKIVWSWENRFNIIRDYEEQLRIMENYSIHGLATFTDDEAKAIRDANNAKNRLADRLRGLDTQSGNGGGFTSRKTRNRTRRENRRNNSGLRPGMFGPPRPSRSNAGGYIPSFAKGGTPKLKEGITEGEVDEGKIVEVHGGEAIINQEATKANHKILMAMNKLGAPLVNADGTINSLYHKALGILEERDLQGSIDVKSSMNEAKAKIKESKAKALENLTKNIDWSKVAKSQKAIIDDEKQDFSKRMALAADLYQRQIVAEFRRDPTKFFKSLSDKGIDVGKNFVNGKFDKFLSSGSKDAQEVKRLYWEGLQSVGRGVKGVTFDAAGRISATANRTLDQKLGRIDRNATLNYINSQVSSGEISLDRSSADLYFAGSDQPILLGSVLDGDGYFDTHSGKRIKNWTEITGDVSDKAGAVIVTLTKLYKNKVFTRIDGKEELYRFPGLDEKYRIYMTKREQLQDMFNSVRGSARFQATMDRAKKAHALVKKLTVDDAIDVYHISDLTTPKLTAAGFAAGEYYCLHEGKRVVLKTQQDIIGTVYSKVDNSVLLSEKEIKQGLFDKEQKHIKISKWKFYRNRAIDKGFDFYNRNISKHVDKRLEKVKTGARDFTSRALGKNYDKNPIDIYTPNNNIPAVTANQFKEGIVFSSKTGKPIRSHSGIDGEVKIFDPTTKTYRIAISKEDLEIGLIDSNGKKIFLPKLSSVMDNVWNYVDEVFFSTGRMRDLKESNAHKGAQRLINKKFAKDVYIVGDPKTPVLTAKKMLSGVYIDKETGNVIRTPEDIEGPVLEVKEDGTQTIVLDEEQITKGLVDSKGDKINSFANGIRLGMIGRLEKFNQGKKFHAQLLSRANKRLNKIEKAKNDLASRLTDIYHPDNMKSPLVKVKDMVDGNVVSAKTGKPITRLSQVSDGIVDLQGNVIVSESDIKRGLVDKNGIPIAVFKGLKGVGVNMLRQGSYFLERLKKGIKEKKEGKETVKEAKKDGPGWLSKLLVKLPLAFGGVLGKLGATIVGGLGSAILGSIKMLTMGPLKIIGTLLGGRLGGIGKAVGLAAAGAAGIGAANMYDQYQNRKAEFALDDPFSAQGEQTVKEPGMFDGITGNPLVQAAGGMLAGSALWHGGKFALAKGLPLLGKVAIGAVSLTGKMIAGAIGFLATPVGLAALGVGAAVGAAYLGYKYIYKNAVNKWVRFKFMQYGFDFKNETIADQITKLEQIVLPLVKINSDGTATTTFTEKKMKEVLVLFGYIDDQGQPVKDKEQYMNSFLIWLRQRFLPVFTSHMSATKKVLGKPMITDYSKLPKDQQQELITLVHFRSTTNSPYNIHTSPFEGEEVEYGVTDVDKQYRRVVAEIRKMKDTDNQQNRITAKENDIEVAKDGKDIEKKLEHRSDMELSREKVIDPKTVIDESTKNVRYQQTQSALITKAHNEEIKKATEATNQATESMFSKGMDWVKEKMVSFWNWIGEKSQAVKDAVSNFFSTSDGSSNGQVTTDTGGGQARETGGMGMVSQEELSKLGVTNAASKNLAELANKPVASKYDGLMAKIYAKYGFTPAEMAILKAQVAKESGFNPNVVSPKGAKGLTQFMPATLRGFGKDGDKIPSPEEAIELQAKYMRQLLKRYKGDWKLALAAYNAGMGNVDKHGGIPPIRETQGYVKDIMGSAGLFPVAGSVQTGGNNQATGFTANSIPGMGKAQVAPELSRGHTVNGVPVLSQGGGMPASIMNAGMSMSKGDKMHKFGVISADAAAVGITHFKFRDNGANCVPFGGGINVARGMVEPLRKLIAAARADGVSLTVGSGYRSIEHQQNIITKKKSAGQKDRQIYYKSAPAGFSEHHTGFVVDFSPIDDRFLKTAGYRWLLANARNYGFVQTFTAKYSQVTGMSEESWHWKYIGSQEAINALTPIGGNGIPYLNESSSGANIKSSGNVVSATPVSTPKQSNGSAPLLPAGEGVRAPAQSNGTTSTRKNNTAKGDNSPDYLETGTVSKMDAKSLENSNSKGDRIAWAAMDIWSRGMPLQYGAKSVGLCGRGVMGILRHSGIVPGFQKGCIKTRDILKWPGGAGHAYVMDSKLTALGYQRLPSNDGPYQNGDIQVMTWTEARRLRGTKKEKPAKEPYGHVQVYCNGKWYSDHEQGEAYNPTNRPGTYKDLRTYRIGGSAVASSSGSMQASAPQPAQANQSSNGWNIGSNKTSAQLNKVNSGSAMISATSGSSYQSPAPVAFAADSILREQLSVQKGMQRTLDEIRDLLKGKKTEDNLKAKEGNDGAIMETKSTDNANQSQPENTKAKVLNSMAIADQKNQYGMGTNFSNPIDISK